MCIRDSVPLVDGLDLRFEFRDLVLKLRLLVLELLDRLLKVGLAVLSLQLLPHREGNGGLIKRLVGADRHLDLVPNSEQQQAALGLGQGNLTDDFVEALREELFTHRADARLTSLPVHQLRVKVLSKASHIDAGGRRVRHVRDVVFAILNPLVGRQDSIKNVFTGRFGVCLLYTSPSPRDRG